MAFFTLQIIDTHKCEEGHYSFGFFENSQSPNLFLCFSRLFHETQLTLKAVDKALTYFRNNPKTLFDDVKLGVFLARSNLQWISDRFQSRFGNDHFMNKVLGEMMRMCDHVLEMNKTQNCE